MIFCYKGNLSMVDLIMKHQPNLNAKDQDGNTALHYCVLSPNINLAILDFFISNNFDFSIQNNLQVNILISGKSVSFIHNEKNLYQNWSCLQTKSRFISDNQIRVELSPVDQNEDQKQVPKVLWRLSANKLWSSKLSVNLKGHSG